MSRAADLILSLSLTTAESDEAGFVHALRRKLASYHCAPWPGSAPAAASPTSSASASSTEYMMWRIFRTPGGL